MDGISPACCHLFFLLGRKRRPVKSAVVKNLEITDAQAKYILVLMEENQHWYYGNKEWFGKMTGDLRSKINSILQGEKS